VEMPWWDVPKESRNLSVKKAATLSMSEVDDEEVGSLTVVRINDGVVC